MNLRPLASAIFFAIVVLWKPFEATAQTELGVFRQLNASDELLETYAEFRFYKNKNRPKAALAGDKAIELAEREFGLDHPVLALVHLEVSSIKILLTPQPFAEIERHVSLAVKIRSRSGEKLEQVDAIILGAMAEMYLDRGRYRDAEPLLSLIYQHRIKVFSQYFEDHARRLRERESEYLNYDRSNTNPKLAAYIFGDYRSALMAMSAFFRAAGDEKSAEKHNTDAELLEPLPVRKNQVPENPYVRCKLPGDIEPVNHKRRTCKSMGGTEVAN